MIRRFGAALDRAGPHYLALIFAGLFGAISSPPSVNSTLTSLVSVVFWLASLIVGGTLCSIGRWRRSRGQGLKILGLMLLIVALSTYVLALSVNLPDSGLAIGLFVSFISLLVKELTRVRKAREYDLAAGSGAAGRSDLVENLGNRASRRRYYARWRSGRSVADRTDQAAEQFHTPREPRPCRTCPASRASGARSEQSGERGPADPPAGRQSEYPAL